MDRGPRRRVVQRVLWECLSRLRLHHEEDEADFAAAVRGLPDFLRECAALLESPPADLVGHPEVPGLGGYSRWAETYDHEPDNGVVAGEEAVIWEVIGDVSGLRVLDVGCGTGRHALRLAACGAEVVGLEPTPEMLARARRKARESGLRIRLEQAGLEDLGAPLGEFDVVLCCLVLSHVADLSGAVAHLAARVRPGGRLVLSDFHPLNLLLGARTSFASAGAKYVVPNFLHLPSEYFHALGSAGLAVTHFLESGGMARYPGVPLALVMASHKPGGHAG